MAFSGTSARAEINRGAPTTPECSFYRGLNFNRATTAPRSARLAAKYSGSALPWANRYRSLRQTTGRHRSGTSPISRLLMIGGKESTCPFASRNTGSWSATENAAILHAPGMHHEDFAQGHHRFHTQWRKPHFVRLHQIIGHGKHDGRQPIQNQWRPSAVYARRYPPKLFQSGLM